MFRCVVLTGLVLLMSAVLYAQTPVEKVIYKYENAQGARNFIAQGVKLDLARRLMRTTQVAPIASDVDLLAILKMQGAPQNIRVSFVHDLDDALKSYESYGKQPSKNGEVEVYVLRSGPDTVEELVVYNPAIYSLNSFHGHFTVNELEGLEK